MFKNHRKIHAVVAFSFTGKSKNMRYSDIFQPLDFILTCRDCIYHLKSKTLKFLLITINFTVCNAQTLRS